MPRSMWRMPLIALEEARHGPGRERVPEPMVMDDPDSVEQFHAGGVSGAGMMMIYDFNARALNALLPRGARLLDLGVGSGRAVACLARHRPDVRITGVDLAPNMLATARNLFEAEGLDDRIELVESDITALPDSITGQSWDAISCMWTLHQLPDVEILRGALRQIARLRDATGAAVWLFDFARLRGPETFRSLVTVVDPDLPPVLFDDALASEAAGFTHDELRGELLAANLGDLHGGISRPIRWCQAFWAQRADGRPGGSPDFRPERLPRRARGDAVMLRAGFTNTPF